MSRTRILVISDTHTGHRGGLTPPSLWDTAEHDETFPGMWARLQREAWDYWTEWVAKLQPIDVAFHLWDVIEGSAPKNRATELLTADLHQQATAALEVLAPIKPRRGWCIVAGTPYHTATDGADWDGWVANELGTTCHDHAWVEVDKQTFDLKHQLGGSSTPTGGDIALRKEILWSHEWHLEMGWPLSDWILRGHTHRWRRVDNAQCCPSLQLWTKFGGRKCSNYVHFGLMWADIEHGGITWHRDTKVLTSARPSRIVL